MSVYKGTTHAMTKFLRACSKNPLGPAPEDWPTATILRRWLRRKSFRRAFLTIQESHRLRSDFHLSAAGSYAAHSLELLTQNNTLATLDDQSKIENQKSKILSASTVLRLSHLRQRFSPSDPSIENPKSKKGAELATARDLENPPELTEEQATSLLKYAINLLTRAHPKATAAETAEYWTEHFDKLLIQFRSHAGEVMMSSPFDKNSNSLPVVSTSPPP
jgi:hypothetical protein